MTICVSAFLLVCLGCKREIPSPLFLEGRKELCKEMLRTLVMNATLEVENEPCNSTELPQRRDSFLQKISARVEFPDTSSLLPNEIWSDSLYMLNSHGCHSSYITDSSLIMLKLTRPRRVTCHESSKKFLSINGVNYEYFCWYSPLNDTFTVKNIAYDASMYIRIETKVRKVKHGSLTAHFFVPVNAQ